MISFWLLLVFVVNLFFFHLAQVKSSHARLSKYLINLRLLDVSSVWAVNLFDQALTVAK